MRRILVTAIAAIAILFAVPPVEARADVNSFIASLEYAPGINFTGPVDWYVKLGYMICADYENGFSYAEIAKTIYLNMNFDIIAANYLVGTALHNLCPNATNGSSLYA